MVLYIFGFIFSILLLLQLRVLYLVFVKNGQLARKGSRRDPAKTLIILGSGGHTTEMLRIVARMDRDRYSPRVYVQADTDRISWDKAKESEAERPDYRTVKISRSREVHQSYLSSVRTTLVAAWDSLPIVWTETPELILCNGPGTCSMNDDTVRPIAESIPWEALSNDIEADTPSEIRVHLVPIFDRLRTRIGTDKKGISKEWIETSLIRLEACLDRTWETLNSGYWKNVPIRYRYCYSFCSVLKSLLMIIQYENASEKSTDTGLEKLMEIVKQVDKGILLGAPPRSAPQILTKIASRLNNSIIGKKVKSGDSREAAFHDSTVSEELLLSFAPVARYREPSMETFYRDIFMPKTPAVLEGCMRHWKALHLWKDPGYLTRVAGVRTVPIEIGSRYTEEDWTQHLVTFSEFVESHVSAGRSSKPGYLAQHQLFEQIPELKDDIAVPEYCSFSDNDDEATAPDTNAWFGPGGTVSPLHYDPKNNLLCQVFGYKRVILYDPEDSPNLYPYETRLLSNTAQVDPVNSDFEKYPKFKEAKGTTCRLGPGEMLFIPPHWWHHVTALSPSFSVSFWWD